MTLLVSVVLGFIYFSQDMPCNKKKAMECHGSVTPELLQIINTLLSYLAMYSINKIIGTFRLSDNQNGIVCKTSPVSGN